MHPPTAFHGFPYADLIGEAWYDLLLQLARVVYLGLGIS